MRTNPVPWRPLAATLATGMVVALAPSLPASAAPADPASRTDLAAGKATAATSAGTGHEAAKIADGDQASYWQGSGAWPQAATVDLGGNSTIDRVTLKLPKGWSKRTQTLAIQGSPDGTSYSTIVGSASYTFSPSAGNLVTVKFPATNTRYVRADVTANSGAPAAQLAELEVHRAAVSNVNLAAAAAVVSMSASSFADVYGAGNANDGNANTYWESANNAFPQWIQADLGSAVGVNRVVLKLPPASAWQTRTQTLSVQGSTNSGGPFSTIVASAGYTFNPATGNTVTINFNNATARYVRLNITGNTGWPAGQLSEFEVYGPTEGDTQAPSTPGNLAYTQPGAGQIRLTWNASTDNVGVTGYDIYANGTLRTSVAGNVLTYTDSQPATATVSYYVRAKDAAGNQSGNSNTVTRTGTPGGDNQAPTVPSNLTFTEPGAGQIRLAWGASSDNTAVTGYDIYANGSVRASVAGNVLTYTDSQPATATVSYYVRAKDAAGNVSGNSNTVTRNGSGGGGSNLAVGKPVTASGSTFTFVPTNANDNNLATYWEGNNFPSVLTVALGANATVNQIVVKLNPDASWGPRTQNIQVLGREQSGSSFTSLSGAQGYSFNPATGNTVTIPVSATVADVRLSIASNSGAPGGQVAEIQIIGVPAPNPDLTVTGMAFTPASPVETDAVTLSATVRNAGSAASPASNVNFYLGTTLAGTASVGGLAAGASTTVTANVGPRNAGTYPLSAKVDEANTVIEQNDANNSFSNPSSLVVAPVASSDLVVSPVAWSPSNPAAGNTVTFTVAIRNQGTVASAGGAHGITLTVVNPTNGAVLRTLTGSYTGTIAAGATTAPVNLGTWTAVNGRYDVRVVLADDANELPVKRVNNTSTTGFFVGRGANLPYEMYEAEDGLVGGGAQVVGPNRIIGDLAGEASGRRAVTLNSTGNFVEFTTKASTNTLVTRFSIPDAPGGGGINSTLNVYVDNVFHKAIPLTSKYIWLYGAEASPNNSPGSGSPRHIYDEANIFLDATIPAGSKIKLQKDAANTTTYAIDFINTELVSAVGNPDPARFAVPTGFTHQDVQNALDRARQDANLIGVYLPAGTYQTQSKFNVYGKALQIVGAGPWYTRFTAPANQENTDVGFDAQASANGSTFTGFSYFGNYTSRNDGPGKVFNLSRTSNMTFDNIWVEHQMCMFWGLGVTNTTIKNSRIRNTYADGTNMTNGSNNNLISNVEGRTNGDDAFALFSATDSGGGANTGNVFENLTATLTWRAAGVAVYGGQNNIFRNMYIADMLTYSGITVSSLDFGYPFIGFGPGLTRIENVSLIRAGGHFWGAQTFPAIWMFAASKEFRAIRISDVDIVDPTYHGIMFQSNYSGGQATQAITDTIFTNISISGAQKSGDAFDAKSGFGIWANEMPEPGQGPVVGSATFNNVRFSNNFQNIRNTTSTFTLTINP